MNFSSDTNCGQWGQTQTITICFSLSLPSLSPSKDKDYALTTVTAFGIMIYVLFGFFSVNIVSGLLSRGLNVVSVAHSMDCTGAEY